MHYTMHQLQVFLRVAQTQSVTRAAEALHLTQPAVSIQLKKFQDQFAIPLTEVVGRRLYITDFGREVAQAAEQILDRVQAMEDQSKARSGVLTGRLKMSVVSTGKYVMPYFLAGFMQAHAAVELEMDVTNKSKVLDALAKNEVDFALVSILPEHLGVEKIELLQNKLYLVGSGHAGGAGEKVHDKKIFEQLPLIYREQGSGTRKTMESYIERKRLPVRKKMELTSNEAVKQAVIAGLGYSIMPLIGIKNELLNGDLQIIPVRGFPIRSVWNLIWLKGKKHSPPAQAFLSYVRKEKAKIIDARFDWYERY